MPPKRKHVENADYEGAQSDPIFASEVDWLDCLTHPSKALIPDGEAAEEKTNTKRIMEACRLTYILYHDVQEHECLTAILKHLNKSSTEDDRERVRVAKHAQAIWKSYVVNKFLLPHVKEVVRKWSVAHQYASFKKLPKSERHKLWVEAYDLAPEKTVIAMWKPLINVLDVANIFRMDLPTEADAKMRAVRHMLKEKYLFGCECTFEHTVVTDQKVRGLSISLSICQASRIRQS